MDQNKNKAPEAVIEALAAMRERIRELHRQLDTIIEDPDKHEQIAAIGAQQLRLLPAPQEVEA